MTRAPRPPRRWPAAMGWPALLLAGLAGAGTPPAPPPDPAQAVTLVYGLMHVGRCAEARVLRPELADGQCAGFALESIQARVWGVRDELALVELDAHYRQGDTAVSEQGCAVLGRDGDGWRWQAFAARPCGDIATSELRRGGDGTGAPVAAPPPSGLDGAATVVPGLPAPFAPVLPEPAATPGETGVPLVPTGPASGDPAGSLAAYYAAHNAGDCATVARLRPGYAGCGAIHEVQLSAVEQRLSSPQAGVVVLGFRVSYVPNDAGTGAVRERLDGLAWMERGPDGWRVGDIQSQAQFAAVQARFQERLRQGQDLATGAVAVPEAPAEALSAWPAASTGAPTSLATLRLSPDAPTVVPTPGAACWTPEALAGNPAEAAIRGRLPPGGTPPPTHLVEQATATPGPWGPGLRGSIRWVDLADPDGRLLALTFDLCEQADETTGYDGAIVDYLREKGVPATFFAGGKWMQTHPERAQQLLADPNFEVGNHAWTHGNLRVLKGGELREQILWAQAEYQAQREALAAQCPAEARAAPALPGVFRFPYGTCGAEALDTLAELGLAAVQWDIVSGDPARGQTAEGIVRTVKGHLKPGRGHIVVMHANGRGRATAAALRRLIPDLRQQGWEFVTVSKLLRAGTPHVVDECYEVIPGDNARYDRLFGRGTGD